jgi:cellulose/xylan binding protein with CBM9 domain
MTPPALVLVLLLGSTLAVVAAEPEYTAAKAAVTKAALLGAEEASWAGAQRVTWGPAAYETAFRAAWKEDGLFLRFDARDPNPWHTMTRRDDHLWEEEVVEIFLDLDRSGHDYYELEISPANVVCDVRMISPWPDKKGDFDWNLAGLETSVHMRTDTAGKTTGWTATAFLPWSGFRSLPSSKAIALPPKPGDRWRFNLFRVKRPGGKSAPEKDAIEAAWSETGGPSFHVPKAFRDLVFADSR